MRGVATIDFATFYRKLQTNLLNTFNCENSSMQWHEIPNSEHSSTLNWND